jgi:hypothetical protein
MHLKGERGLPVRERAALSRRGAHGGRPADYTCNLSALVRHGAAALA